LAKGVEAEHETAPVRFKRFHDLVPHFKSSDFDYIIFDMPPIGQTSPTAGMARFMDKVLFVIESEKCHRDQVKRAYADLVTGRENVGVVFNKVRSHAPRWIEGDLN
jgi:Mrp family chromosome partitioning ATPase